MTTSSAGETRTGLSEAPSLLDTVPSWINAHDAIVGDSLTASTLGGYRTLFERAKLEPMSLRLVETRLLDAGRKGRPLLGPIEGPGTLAVFDRVLDVAARVYPREVATIHQQLRRETNSADSDRPAQFRR